MEKPNIEQSGGQSEQSFQMEWNDHLVHVMIVTWEFSLSTTLLWCQAYWNAEMLEELTWENEWMFLSEQLHVGTCGSIAYFHWNLTTVLTTGQTTCTAAAILQRSTRVTHFRGFLIVEGSLSKFYHHSWIKFTHMGMIEERFFTEVHKYVTGRWWRHGPAVNFSELTEVTGLRMAASCWEVLHGDTECSSSCAHAQWSR